MFTGIIEALGMVKTMKREGDNLNLTIQSPFTKELKIDQSIAHNGVCLTVVDLVDNEYIVTAIKETVSKTNLGFLKEGEEVNIERCMRLGDRLDGHIVQGHIDSTAEVEEIKKEDGSWLYTFLCENENLVVSKGSICVNGVSLTVVDPTEKGFSVAIIPYTYENTTFKNLKKGEKVNLEYDIIGKYVQKMIS